MKKSYLIIIGLIVQTQICYSQNLIRNPDFEDGPEHSAYGWENQLDGCVVSGSMDGPDYWYKVNLTPDRLINGDITCDFSQIDAQSGKAYVDFVYGESGKTFLVEPLQKGETYILTFWARWQTFQDAATEPSGIQFIFSNNGNILKPLPIENKDEWKQFTISFIAKSDSKEMEIMGTIDKFGGVCVDNMSLTKIGDEPADTLAPTPRAELKRFLEQQNGQ